MGPRRKQLSPLRRYLTRRDQRGQALPLAAVGIFAMALGVLATLNLGQAVHEKIKLQNTADATAYSLAAMEARTFNYIAFLNRSQIAHYNTAMVVQSYMTWVGFQVALFGTAVDMLIALKNAVDYGASLGCPYLGCPYIPLKVPAMLAMRIGTMFRKIAVQLQNAADRVGHYIVEAMSILNYRVVWQAQMARALLLNGHIMTGMQSYVTKMDPDISFTSGKSRFMNMAINGALNSLEYYKTFDNASGVNPFFLSFWFDLGRIRSGGAYNKRSDTKAKDAYRIMTELCSATRTPQFVSNRSSSSGDSARAMVILGTITGTKMGQTKFTEQGDLSGAKISALRSEGNYTVGKYLSSDDHLQAGGGIASLGIAGAFYVGSSKLGDAIAAYESNGKHYRYKEGGTSGAPAPSTGEVTAYPFFTPGKKTVETKNHAPWHGFAPYVKFKPRSDRSADFNQPSAWIFLNKHHKDFQTAQGSLSDGEAPWFTKLSWQQGSKTVTLDSTIGGKQNSYLFEGLNVISRAMAYYHRKDNWTEHPNFFNPYWRARLAPVGQKLQTLWDGYVTQNITTSSDSAVIKGMVNLLRNAQMDFFTTFITSVITH